LVLLFFAVMVRAQSDCAVELSVQYANCNNERGRIQVNPIGGVSPYQYQWSDNAHTKNNAVAKNLSSGSYAITVTDAVGCTVVDSAVVKQMTSFSVRGELLPTICDANWGDIKLHVDGAQPDVTYLYSVTNTAYFFDNTFQYLEPGPHTLYVKTDDDCVDSTQFTIPYPHPLFLELGDDYIVSLGDSVRLDGHSYDTRFVTFDWTPKEGLSCSDCPYPTVTIAKDTEFELTVADSVGCTTSDVVRVLVQKDRNVYVPTAFSPNADGVNDEFYIFAGEGVVAMRDLSIYNRWGSIVHRREGIFPANDFRMNWDGKTGGTSVSTGSYTYQFTAIFMDGAQIPYYGTVQVHR
ncbi:MAG: gliding motility-associated C-terminal domain-containing protein, partial [Bacteroidota bacterium]